MQVMINPEEVESWNIHEGIMAKIVAEGENMTAMMSIYGPKAGFGTHVHPHEQVAICLEGEMVFIVADREYTAKKGFICRVPPNVPHAERNDTNERAVFIDCFAPAREDLLRKRFEQKMVK